jgi:hypothetical protein
MNTSLPCVPLLAQRACSDWTWCTYPHCNGFTADGRAVILGRFDGTATVLLRHDLATGREDEVARISTSATTPLTRWFDVSRQTSRLVTFNDDAIVVIDLAGDGAAREVYHAPDGWALRREDIPAIRADGNRIIVCETRQNTDLPACNRVRELDLATGETTDLFSHVWDCNHFHYCPADESWIGYSHEGPTHTIPDRVWGWHRTEAPNGRCVYDQASDTPGVPLCIGHERWMFHRPRALAVAYGVSPHGPRGIWEVPVDGTSPRLVSAGERDWHVNINHTGTLAVLDTTGSLDCAGRGWENSDDRSDILLVDMATGERSWLARTHEAGRGFAGRLRHPFHAHPAFGPDGQTVVFNNYTAAGLPAVSILHF